MSKPAIVTAAPLSAEAYDTIRDEIHRAADAARARMANPTRIICDSRNGFMGRYLAYMRTPYKRGPLQRLAAALENAWAMLWAIWHCWPEMGETLGMWVDIRKEKEECGRQPNMLRTPEAVKKGLEYCSFHKTCRGCPYENNTPSPDCIICWGLTRCAGVYRTSGEHRDRRCRTC